jgi:hypothetical protein
MSLSLVDTIKIFTNTIIRIIPIGLYTGSAMSGVVFQDFRGILLFCGFLGNELLSLGYRMILHGTVNPQCALTYSIEGSPFVLPSPISQTVGFFAGFFFMEMYFNSTFSSMKFFLLSIMLIITIYSRINIGCKTLLDAIYCALVGLLIGVIYFNLVKDYYKADYLETEIIEASKEINNFFSIN